MPPDSRPHASPAAAFNGGQRTDPPLQGRAEQRLFVLSTFIELEQRARRAATEAELGYVMVNETLRLTAFRQALFFAAGPGGRLRLRAASGVDTVEPHSPFVTFLRNVLAPSLDNEKEAPAPIPLDTLAANQQERCRHYGIGALLWVPMTGSASPPGTGLLLIRDGGGWSDGEREILARLADAYGHAWQAVTRRRSLLRRLGHRFCAGSRLRIAAILAVAVLALMPVRLSVLAPVEIVPRSPVVVSPPRDGIIQDMAVSPNQTVRSGQILFRLEDTPLRNAHEVAQKSLAVLEADRLRLSQKAFADAESRAQVALLKARIDQKQAEVDYLEEMLAQSRVRADGDGLALFDDVGDWVGRPVQVGEKVMTIADPQRIEADIRLPVADAINLAPGAEVRIFLNIHPDRPLAATLRSAGFAAQPTAQGILAFRLRADLDGRAPGARIGLRGTARIYGEPVTLGYYLFRRPLAALRIRMGV